MGDDVLDALSDLVAALSASAERIRSTIRRAEAVREERFEGRSYREIEAAHEGAILEFASQNLAVLGQATSRLRRAEARALYAEGMTMEEIARLFGVTRQRVSALLRGRPEGR